MKINYFLKFAKQVLPLLAFLFIGIQAQAQTKYTFTALGASSGGFESISTSPTGANIVISDNATFDSPILYHGIPTTSAAVFTFKGDGINTGSFTFHDMTWRGYAGGDRTLSTATQIIFKRGAFPDVTWSLSPAYQAILSFSDTEHSAKTIFGESGSVTGVTEMIITVKFVGATSDNTELKDITLSAIAAPVVAAAPTITAMPASGVTATSTTLNANVTADGGDPITERGFLYALTSADPTPTLGESTGTNVTKVVASGTTGAFNETIASLTTATGYSFAAYATNGVGTTESAVQTFTTNACSPPKGSAIEFHNGIPRQLVPPSNSPIISNVDGNCLTFFVNNSTGTHNISIGSAFGSMISGTDFGLVASSVAGGEASNYGIKSDVSSSNFSLTSFEFGVALASNNTITIQGYDDGALVSGAITKNIIAGINIFTISNADLTTAGGFNNIDEIRFSLGTPQPSNFAIDTILLGIAVTSNTPSISINTATSLTATSATLSGIVTSDGGDAIIERGFVYSLTSADTTPTLAESTGTNVTKVVVSGTTGVFNETISSLIAASGYSFAAYASNSIGTTESTVQTFTTSVPTVSLSLSGNQLAENTGVATIIATLSTASSKNITVTIDATGTATGIDYNLSSTTITINAGATTGTATITGVNDALDEGNETVILDIIGVVNVIESGTQQVTATIIDDGDVVSMVAFQSFESNSLDTWNYTVDPAPYATETDSIIDGSEDIWSVIRAFTGDIEAASNGVNFWGTQDLNNNNGGRNSFHTITFDPIDISAQGELKLEFDYFSKGFDSADLLEYEVLFDNGTSWSANGTGLTKSNLAWETISVNVPASANFVRIRIQVKQDGSSDFSGWDNFKLSSGSSVNNNRLAFASTSSSGLESVSSKDLTVNLSAASSNEITVAYAVSGTATGTGTDFTLANGTLTFTPLQTSKIITIASIVNDVLDEVNETVIVTLSSPSNAALGTNVAHTYTITDNDAAPTVTLGLSGSPLAENGGVATITATLNTASSKNVTVTIAPTGTATGTDYTLSSTTIIINAGSTTGTATITGDNDAIDEPAETVIIDITGVTNATESGTQQVTASITDDDAAPAVTLSLSGSSVSENGGIATITASLNTASGQEVAVTIEATGTATGIDYNLSSTIITIPAGSTSGTATITGVNDALDEGNETVVIDITGVFNATESGTQQVTATITDELKAPSITFTSILKTYGDANFNLGATSNSIGAITYTIVPGGTGMATLSGVSNEIVTLGNAGIVTIRASQAADGSFTSGTKDVTLTINKALLIVDATDATKVYGDENPLLWFNYLTTSFKNGDTHTALSKYPQTNTTATKTSNVGTEIITVSGGEADNYDFSYTSAILTITKAPLTATADISREYGDVNPVFTIAYVGFKNSETASVLDAAPIASTTATTTTNVGTAVITLSGGTDNNYTVTSNNGILTINKATLIVTAQDTTVEYGDNFSISFEYGAFKNGEDASVLNNGAYVYIDGDYTNVGTYTIVPDAVSDNNYTPSYVNGTLTKTKAALTATAEDKSRDYGEANPEFTISYTGFKNGDTEVDLDTKPSTSSAATETTSAGEVDIDITQGSDVNYTITGIKGTLTILAVTDDSPKVTPKLKPATAITPNSDGINDNWIIPGITSYPNSKVSVYNRNGQVVFEAKSYQNNWGGTYKSEGKLPTGSYYYVIDLGNGSEPLVGWIFY